MCSRNSQPVVQSRWCFWLSAVVFVLAVTAACTTTRKAEPDSDDAVPEHVLAETKRLYGLAMDHWIAQIARLAEVSQRVRVAGNAACGRRVSPVLGAAAIRVEEAPVVLEAIVKKRFGESEGMHVVAVYPDMAANRAGLEIGDAVLAIDGSPLKRSQDFYVLDSGKGEFVSLDIERAGERLTIQVELDLGCATPVHLRIDEILNAFARRKSITVTTALMRAFPDDAMLAQIVGHELGHIIHRHTNRSFSGLSMARRREALADYVGIYLAAMAGYPIVTETELILGLHTEIQYFGDRTSHPSTPARDLALRKTLEEIRGKQERGEPIELSPR